MVLEMLALMGTVAYPNVLRMDQNAQHLWSPLITP